MVSRFDSTRVICRTSTSTGASGTSAVKDLGSDIKQGTEEAAAKTKVAADKAGEQLKAGAKDAGAKTDDALNKAKDKVEK